MVKNISTNNPDPVHFFCSNLKYLLKKFGVNQTELANFMDRQQTTVSNWMNGISVPDVDDLVKIYHFFGFSIDALILTDLSESQVMTDKYVARFKKLPGGGDADTRNMMEEPDAVFNKSVIEQLRIMDSKLDKLQLTTEGLAGKKSKQPKK